MGFLDTSLGFADTADPSKTSSDFEKFPSGKHQVMGIFGYGTVDESGTPFYKEINSRTAARISLRMADKCSCGKEHEPEGPPMTVDAAQLALLVAAFAGEEAVKLLPEDRSTVQYLLTALAAANCDLPSQANKKPAVQEVTVNDEGWATFVTGASLPSDRIFRWKVRGFRSIDGGADEIHFAMTNYGKGDREIVRVDMVVAGDLHGKKTIYDGARVTVDLENPFNGTTTIEDSDGFPHTLPAAKVNVKTNSRPISVARMRNFVRCFWPEMGKYEWQTDATRSDYGVNEAADPIVVIADKVMKGGMYAIGKLSQAPKSNRLFLDVKELVPPEDAGTIVIEDKAEEDSKFQDSMALVNLADFIDKQVKGEHGKDAKAFKDVTNYSLTAEGVAWCKENMLEFWDKLGLPKEGNNRKLTLLDEEQAKMLLDAIKAKFAEGF
jgi:hypothetical protein